jgi:hypothetical protein
MMTARSNPSRAQNSTEVSTTRMWRCINRVSRTQKAQRKPPPLGGSGGSVKRFHDHHVCRRTVAALKSLAWFHAEMSDWGVVKK